MFLSELMSDCNCISNIKSPSVLNSSSNESLETHIAITDRTPNKTIPRTKRRRIKFSKTHVFYFQRVQGFSSVPERGGCSLGMETSHFHSEKYGALQYCRIRRVEKRLQWGKRALSNFDNILSPGDARRVPLFFSPPQLSPQSYDHHHIDNQVLSSFGTPPPPCLSPQKEKFITPTAPTNDIIEVSEILDTDSETSSDSLYSKCGRPKLHKITPKMQAIQPPGRSKLLRISGVTNIDESEKWACANLRASRSIVGCCCSVGQPCNPESCSCALDGIPCQVDRPAFPCTCDSSRCGNPYGRVEFSPSHVRSHASHVFDRLAFNQLPFSSPSNMSSGFLSTVYGECVACIEKFPLHKLADSTLSDSRNLLRNSPQFRQMKDESPLCNFKEASPAVFVTPVALALKSKSALYPITKQPEISPTVLSNGDSALVTPVTRVAESFPLGDELPTKRSLIGALSPGPPVEPSTPNTPVIPDMTPFGRLSLRKRRIIRSPIPTPRRRLLKKYNGLPCLPVVSEAADFQSTDRSPLLTEVSSTRSFGLSHRNSVLLSRRRKSSTTFKLLQDETGTPLSADSTLPKSDFPLNSPSSVSHPVCCSSTFPMYVGTDGQSPICSTPILDLNDSARSAPPHQKQSTLLSELNGVCTTAFSSS